MYYFTTRLAGSQAQAFLYTAIIALMPLLFVNSPVCAQIIIPTDNASPFYYELGGGKLVSLPPSTTHTLDLGASLRITPGYQCGRFNPAISLTTTLNKLKDTLTNIKKSVVQNVTAAVAELPMYEIARLNPTLYNILTHNLLEADTKIRVATKSCEQMQAEIAQGKNPYKAWATLAIGNQWEKHIGTALIDDAADDGTHDKATREDSRSITSVKHAIDAHADEAGVPWINDKEAGGKSQPAIHVIKDTVTTAYNTLDSGKDSHLKTLWHTATAAADWVVDVIGDRIITSDKDKSKNAPVGKGLLPLLRDCKAATTSTSLTCENYFVSKLSALVQNPSEVTQKNLQALSTSVLAMSPAVMRALSLLSPVLKQLFIHKLAKGMALQNIVDRALLARRLLLIGRQKPVIASNAPAIKVINSAIKRLENDINALLWENHIRHETLVTPLQQLLRYTATQQQHLMPPMPTASKVMLEHGAIKNKVLP